MSEENRQYKRFSVGRTTHLNATVVLQGNSLINGGSFSTMEFPAKPKDLSLGGIGLTFSYPMNFSAPDFNTCKLFLRTGGSTPPLQGKKASEVVLAARLAHFDPSRGRMGLAFEKLSRTQAEFIESYLNT